MSNVLFDLDSGVLAETIRSLNATPAQVQKAFDRALRRTGQTMRGIALAEVKNIVKPTRAKALARRLPSPYFLRGQGVTLSRLKLWIGLNALPVGDLKGRKRGPKSGHHTERDPRTGRYVAVSRRRQPVTFTPAGGMPAVTFENAYIGGTAQSKSTILIRHRGRRPQEARIDIYDATAGSIAANVWPQAQEIFLRHFRTDLEGRIRAGIR